MRLVLEGVAVLVAVLLALNWPFGTPAVRGFLRQLGSAGRHRVFTVLLCGTLSLTACAVLSAVAGWPAPSVHDEFSYLLAADTYAHGRVANSVPPFWQHFETFHVIFEPVYASKYPPAQGLLLALGQLLGHPAVGVWLAMGLMAAAVTWLLQAWLPPRWALLGGLLTATHPGMLEYWGHSYWGGAAAALGGALLYGSLRRLQRRLTMPLALLLAVGVALLANSRPFEGFVTSLPAAVILSGGLLRTTREGFASKLSKVVLPAGVVLFIVAAAMLWYNQRVTGNWLLLPYEAHERQYALAPIFFFQAPRPLPDYRHPALYAFHTTWALGCWQSHQGVANLLRASGQKLLILWQFYLSPALTVPLFALPWVLRNRWMKLAGLTCGLVLTAMLLSTFLQPSYVAPITSLLVLLVTAGLRQLSVWKRPAGRFLVAALIGLHVAAFLGTFADLVRRDDNRWERQRARLLSELEQSEGKHLVFVRYGPRHDTLHEWVYNRADLDAAKVIWAREMGPERDEELRRHYADRQVWLIHADMTPPRLVPAAP